MPAHASLRRAFPPREYVRGRSLGSALLGFAATLLLCGVLLSLYLIADLLISRGTVSAENDHLADLLVLTGQATPDEDGVVAIPDGYRMAPGDRGIAHAVWMNRDGVLGPPLAWLYRNVQTLQSNLPALATLIGAAVVLGLMRSLCLSWARLAAARAVGAAVTRLRKALHRQALRLGPSDLTEEAAKEVLGLFTVDGETLRQGLQDGVLRLGRYPAKIIVLTAFSLLVSPLMTFYIAFPLLVCWWLLRRQAVSVKLARRLATHRSDKALRLLAEGLTKARVVRGYGMEEFESDRFNTHLGRYQSDLAAANRKARLSRGLARAALVLAGAVVLGILGTKVLNTGGAFTPAHALLLLGIAFSLLRPLNELADLHRDRHAAAVAADRIYRYLNRVPEVGQAVGAKFLQPLSRTLEFDDVHYTDPRGRKLLDGVSLSLPAGQVTAIAAPESLEAKALVSLPPRFLEPQRGRVKYDGEDIAWVTLESLRAETVYVGGGDPCFTGTVRENLTGGDPEVPLSKVIDAAKTAHVHNFVQRFPQGYETVLGEFGETLTPGQLFRLGLARAVLRDPAVLIVDEPSEGLDEDSKAQLDDTFARVFPGRTVLLLPGRMTTLRRADRVVLLHRGAVEAVGPREELVQKVPLYRHWEYVRFNHFRHGTAPQPAGPSNGRPSPGSPALAGSTA
ncbi:ABC transporter ATP-binding protein [Alienimonas chondri]|uniref:ABC transporter ATP-binding protein n=1 Tax=Alienimonas chondri TaxID=2681879 RepID=A0ABX1V9X9_9PLAN|nr:ABC transporter ATP-binding protein [Alienimonas chondri]NNJ24188.1 hypothetical protein [Alienimonas chondri]